MSDRANRTDSMIGSVPAVTQPTTAPSPVFIPADLAAAPPPPTFSNRYEWENALRQWRMANNRDDYPRFDSHREGFAGIVGVITDRWCKECEQRIDQPHRKGCSVGAKEEGAAPILVDKPVAAAPEKPSAPTPTKMSWRDARPYLITHALDSRIAELTEDAKERNPNYLRELSSAIYAGLEEIERLQGELEAARRDTQRLNLLERQQGRIYAQHTMHDGEFDGWVESKSRRKFDTLREAADAFLAASPLKSGTEGDELK